MRVRVCPKCGKHNLESAFSCIICGATLSINTLMDPSEVTDQNVSNNDDPNPALQSLLTKIEEEIRVLNEKTWQNEIAARTKKMQSLLPIKLYRDDRENLLKIIRELEKFWGLLRNAQDEKSYLDLIKVLDNWTRWIMTN